MEVMKHWSTSICIHMGSTISDFGSLPTLQPASWRRSGLSGVGKKQPLARQTKKMYNKSEGHAIFTQQPIYLHVLSSSSHQYHSIPNYGSMFPRCSQRRSSRVKRTSLRCFHVGQESQESWKGFSREDESYKSQCIHVWYIYHIFMY